MWNKTLATILTIGVIGATGSLAWSDEDETAAVAKYLPTAKVTLQQGLTAAESRGRPISGKFEVDEGHFQLSVYTTQDGKFSEVLVDHNTGKVTKTEAITEGDDLADAKKQTEACGRSKKSLQSAVDKAEQASAGYRAIGVAPKLSGGHAVVVVTLAKGAQLKSVSEPLE
jgi:nanoRNase/pAp phosphatase (c-di-AMP/oligoRNAs hydrolase)